MIHYDPLPTPADCSFTSIQAALLQIGEAARHVSSDVWVSSAWPAEDVKALQDLLDKENCLANRVRVDKFIRPHEWYVECGNGERVGSSPPEPAQHIVSTP